MSWKFYKDLEISDDVQMIHCDTRDFHCSLVTESHSHHASNEKYMFSTDELLALLDRCYEESGGKRDTDWRWLHFVDEEGVLFGGDWQFKYLRFFKVKKDAWICKPRAELKMLEKSFFEGKKCFGDLTESEKYQTQKGVIPSDPDHVQGTPDSIDQGFVDYKTADGNLLSLANSLSGSRTEPVVREGKKIHRNDPCPCGSGKKHKKCCLT